MAPALVVESYTLDFIRPRCSRQSWYKLLYNFTPFCRSCYSVSLALRRLRGFASSLGRRRCFRFLVSLLEDCSNGVSVAGASGMAATLGFFHFFVLSAAGESGSDAAVGLCGSSMLLDFLRVFVFPADNDCSATSARGTEETSASLDLLRFFVMVADGEDSGDGRSSRIAFIVGSSGVSSVFEPIIDAMPFSDLCLRHLDILRL